MTAVTAAADGGGGGGGGGGTPVTLPALGESVTEGTVTRWLKKVGDDVAVDEPLLEVSTDKVDTEIPSPVAGTLLEIKVDEDETVEVGAELAVIGSGGAPSGGGGGAQDRAPEPEPEKEAEPEPAAEEPEPAAGAGARAGAGAGAGKPTAPTHAERTPSSGGEGVYITPLVRKMAAEYNVDLGSIKGTGVGGRIRKQDVLAAASEDAKAEKRAQRPAPAAAEPAAAAPAAPAPATPPRRRRPRRRRARCGAGPSR